MQPEDNLQGKVKKGGDCSLEIETRPKGGVYLSCRSVSCTGTCKVYLVQDEENGIKELGCDCT